MTSLRQRHVPRKRSMSNSFGNGFREQSHQSPIFRFDGSTTHAPIALVLKDGKGDPDTNSAEVVLWTELVSLQEIDRIRFILPQPRLH